MQTNNALRIALLTGLFVVPAIPFIVAGSFFFPFITGKNFTFRILVELLTGLWLILAIRDSAYRPRFSLLTYAFAVFIVVIGVADAFGMNPMRSFWSNFERMEGLVTLMHLLAYFMVLGAVFMKEALWERFLQITLLSSFVMALFSFFQLTGLYVINQGSVRVDGTLGNATYLGIYLVFHIFTALFLLFRQRTREGWSTIERAAIIFTAVAAPLILYFKIPTGATISPAHGLIFAWLIPLVAVAVIGCSFLRREYMYGGLAALFTVSLYFTATRGAILGLIGGVLISAVLIALFAKDEPKIKKGAIGAIIAVVALVALFFAVKDTGFVKNSPVLSRFSSISITERTTTSRFMIWNMAWQGFKERPLLGWGQENFNYVFNKYYDAKMYNQEPWFDRTHNVFFDWLVAGGILGLVAYLSLFGLALYLLWKKSGLSVVERSILTGMLAAYFFHNLFVFDQLVSYIYFTLFLAYIHVRSQQGVATSSKELPDSLAMSLQGVVLVATLAVLYLVNVPGIRANTTLIQALTPHSQTSFAQNIEYFKQALAYNTFGSQEIREQLVQASASIRGANVSNDEKQQLFNLAATEMQKMIKEAPNDARHYLFLGSLLDTYGLSSQSIELLQKAHMLSPQKQAIYFELGSAYIVLKQYDNALATFKEAYELEPSYKEAAVMYAAGAVYAGKDDIAQALITSLGGGIDQRIIGAYKDIGRLDKAIALWSAIVKSQPDNAQAHLSLAGIYFQAGRKAEAISEIRKVIELQPGFKDEGEYYIKQIQDGKTP